MKPTWLGAAVASSCTTKTPSDVSNTTCLSCRLSGVRVVTYGAAAFAGAGAAAGDDRRRAWPSAMAGPALTAITAAAASSTRPAPGLRRTNRPGATWRHARTGEGGGWNGDMTGDLNARPVG